MIAAKRLQRERVRSRDAAPIDATTIADAASQFGLALNESQSSALSQYAALLLRWNSVHNLTAIDSPAQVLTHHLLDSLAIVPEIQRRAPAGSLRVLDVGAGGGLPGIPLAIAAPEMQVTLIDKVQKKIAFLNQVKLELGLNNVTCHHGRVEALQSDSPYEVIVARAFASLAEFVRLTRHLLARHGGWFAMKGAVQSEELNKLKLAPDVRVVETIRLRVPGLQAERHLLVMQLIER